MKRALVGSYFFAFVELFILLASPPSCKKQSRLIQRMPVEGIVDSPNTYIPAYISAYILRASPYTFPPPFLQFGVTLRPYAPVNSVLEICSGARCVRAPNIPRSVEPPLTTPPPSTTRLTQGYAQQLVCNSFAPCSWRGYTFPNSFRLRYYKPIHCQ